MPRHKYDSTHNYRPTGTPNKVYFVKYIGGLRHGKIYVKTRIEDFKGKKIIAWKKAFIFDPDNWRGEYCLVKLEIPANAIRYQPRNHKCRSSRAKVLAIYRLIVDSQRSRFVYSYTREIQPSDVIAMSAKNTTFRYKTGDVLKPTQPFSRKFEYECRSGIHFFLLEQEALDYNI